MSLSSASAPGEDADIPSVLPLTVRRLLTFGRRSSRAVPCLATVPPSNGDSESDVQSAEGARHDPVVPRRRSKYGEGTSEHETDSHHRHDLHEKSAAGNDGRPIQQKPHARNHREEPGTKQHDGEESTDENRRRKAQDEFPTGAGKQRHARFARLANYSPQHHSRSENSRRDPDIQRLEN